MTDVEVTAKDIGGFRILRRLASGATSDVLLARAEGPHGFRRIVALKILLARRQGTPELEQEFAAQASAYARLSTPSVVKLYDFFSADGQVVMVLEFVDGLPLHKLRAMLAITGQRIEDKASLYLGWRVFGALAAAHAARDPATGQTAPVIHFDLNPSNILVPWDGQVKVGDFGIAHAAGVEPDARAGFIKGTYGYSAPEQVAGNGGSERSDIYSAGLILWELLARRKAVQKGSLNDAQVLKAMAHPEFPALELLRPDLAAPVRTAVRRALEPDPDKRTLSAAEMAAILRDAFDVDEGRSALASALMRVRSTGPADPLAATAPLSAQAANDIQARAMAEGLTGEVMRVDPEQTAPFAAMTDDGELGKIAFQGRLNLPAESVPPEKISAPSFSAAPPRPAVSAPPVPLPSAPESLPTTPALSVERPPLPGVAPQPRAVPPLVQPRTLMEFPSRPAIPRPAKSSPALPSYVPSFSPAPFAPAPSAPLLVHTEPAPAPESAPSARPHALEVPTPANLPSTIVSADVVSALVPERTADAPTIVPPPDPAQDAPTIAPPPDPALDAPTIAPPPEPAATLTPAPASPPEPAPSAPAAPPRTERSPEVAADVKAQGSRTTLPGERARADQPPYVQSSLPPSKFPWAIVAVTGLCLAGAGAYVFSGGDSATSHDTVPSASALAAHAPAPLPSASAAASAATAPSAATSASPSGSVSAAPAASAAPSASVAVAGALPSAAPSASVGVPPAAPSASAAASSGASAPSASSAPSAVAAVAAGAAVAAVPSAAPSAAPSPAAPAGDIPADMGEIELPASAAGHRVFVDGKVAGEGALPIRIHCGSHVVRVGSAGTERKIELPCGGSFQM